MTDTAVVLSDAGTPVDAPPLAAWSRRVVAALLDGAILTGATWLVLGSDVAPPSLTPNPGLSSSTGGGMPSPDPWFASPWLVALVVGMLVLQGWTGATPGKRAAGVAIVRVSDGRPAGVFASGLRVLAHLLDAIFLVGYLRPLWNARRQTFADSMIGTLAVETRDPAPHPWFARFRREPSAVRSTVVTGAALAACVVGFGFSTSWSSWGGTWESSVPCTEDSTPAGPTAHAEVTRTGGSMHERRLWVSRPTADGADEGLRITWTWVSGDHTGDALVETHVVRADGSTIEITHDAVPTSILSDTTAFDPAPVPASDLGEAGPGWTAQTRLVVDGETVGACTVDSADWDAAVPPAEFRG